MASLLLATTALMGCADEDPEPAREGAALDAHLHVASQALTDFFTGGGVPAPTGAELVARLDEARVTRGVVLAPGYMPFPDDSYVGPENDYAAAQVAAFPDRLIGFCGINPRFDSAPDEITRCLALPGMVGIKLHLPASEVDLRNLDHVAALAAVFERIDESGAPVMLHTGDPWSQPLDNDAFARLSEIINAHPSVRIAHAHCAGNTDDASIEAWLRVPGSGYRANAFVDTSACLRFYRDAPLATRELMVWRFRQWGIERVLLGSDYLQFQPEETPAEAIETLRQYPFTTEELDVILSNDGAAWLVGASE